MADTYNLNTSSLVLGNGGEIYIANSAYKEHRGLPTTHPFVLLNRFLMDRFLEKSGMAPTTRFQYIAHRNNDPYDCRIGNLMIMDRDTIMRFYELTGRDVNINRIPVFVVHGPFKTSSLQREVLITPDEEINWEYNPYEVKEFMADLETKYMEREEKRSSFKNSQLDKRAEYTRQQLRNSVEGSNIMITVADNIVMINDGFTVMPQVFNRKQGQAMVISIVEGKISINKVNAVED